MTSISKLLLTIVVLMVFAGCASRDMGSTSSYTSSHYTLQERRVQWKKTTDRSNSVWKTGNADDAIELAKEALVIAQQDERVSKPLLVVSLNHLAAFYINSGQDDKAKLLLDQVISHIQQHHHGKHNILPQIYHNLGLIAINQKHYVEAQRQFRKGMLYHKNYIKKIDSTYINLIIKKADLYRKMGEFDQAEKTYLVLYAAIAKGGNIKKPTFVPILVPILKGLSSIYKDKGDWEKAEKTMNRVCALTFQTQKDSSPGKWYCFSELAHVIAHQYRFDEANSLMDDALLHSQVNLGELHPVTLLIQIEQIHLLLINDSLAEAQQQIRLARQAMEQSGMSVDSSLNIQLEIYHADLLNELNQLSESQSVLDSLYSQINADNSMYDSMARVQALLFLKRSEFDRALELLDAIKQRKDEKRSLDASVEGEKQDMVKALLLHNMGQSDAAMEMLKPGYLLAQNQGDLNFFDQWVMSHLMAIVTSHIGDVEKMWTVMNTGMRPYRALLKPSHRLIRHGDILLANQFRKLGHVDTARKVLEQVMRGHSTSMDKRRYPYMSLLSAMGSLEYQAGDLALADTYFKEGLQLSESIFSRSHIVTLNFLMLHANILMQQGDWRSGLERVEEAYQKLKEMLSAGHPEVMRAENLLIHALLSLKKNDQAQSLINTAQDSMQRQLEGEHPERLFYQRNRLHLARNLGQETAYASQLKSLDSVLRKVAKGLFDPLKPSLFPREKHELLKDYRHFLTASSQKEQPAEIRSSATVLLKQWQNKWPDPTMVYLPDLEKEYEESLPISRTIPEIQSL
ncbi:MAG: hypothetical protein HQL54_10200 [Magnetococcales bacterium]|nr:hypothetical protein [Magnetococcales bacterium]